MERQRTTALPAEAELVRQMEYIREIRQENDRYFAETGKHKKFYSLAMGCQMNAHDSEKLEGMLDEMGYERTQEETEADFIIYNTCCVRENAELKVYGKLGWLKHYKKENPDAVVALCGCMMQQDTVLETIRQKYRHVDLVFGTFNLYKLPELMKTREESGCTVFDIWQEIRKWWKTCPASDISLIRQVSTLCSGATISALTALCPMYAAESAAEHLKTFWQKYANLRQMASKKSCCWVRM